MITDTDDTEEFHVDKDYHEVFVIELMSQNLLELSAHQAEDGNPGEHHQGQHGARGAAVPRPHMC